MKVTITRGDPLANVGTDDHAPGILSHEEFTSWDDAFKALRGYGVPLKGQHEEEIKSHPDTQFSNIEFVNFGSAAYTVNVMYDIRVVSAD